MSSLLGTVQGGILKWGQKVTKPKVKEIAPEPLQIELETR